MRVSVKALVLVCAFVCPLLFFTDLTRNPYISQIVLLDLCLVGVLAVYAVSQAREPAWSLPRTPMDAPLAAWILLCVFSWAWSYWRHEPFYRDAILSEGDRLFGFSFINATLLNALLPFYIAVFYVRGAPARPGFGAGRWVAFILVWGLLWALFPFLRSPAGPLARTWPHLWDPYGAAVWAAGLACLCWLAWGATAHHLWHVLLAAGVLSSAYGIGQYFNVDWIWPAALNRYGGRSVSTFGNPNFMSSFAVMLMPLAMAYYLKARDAGGRLAYAAAFLVLEGALLVSLTRSSWAGALAGLGVLAFSRDLRREAKRNIEAHGLFAAAAVSMIVLWPRSTVSVYTPSVYERVRELSSALRVDGNAPYSPLYQRLLIWASAWLMGRENPLWGNGYGLFELFYPFYQGGVLVASDVLRTMRTHGNNAHNEILEAWAQTGILGVGVLLWMWTAFFSACRRRLRNSEDERGRPGDFGPAWTAACAGGVAGMLVDNLLNVSLHFPVPAFLFWWQAGCVMGAPARDEGRWRTLPSGRWPAYAVAALILTACARLAWSEAREWNREVWYFRGFKLLRTGELPAAVDALERARRWDRGDVNADFELGNAYARSGLYPKAAWAYRDALKANAGYDEIYSNLGTVLFRYLGQPAQAEPYYLLSLAINPVALNTYVNLDAVYSRDPRRRADEVELLEGAARLFPDQPIFLKRLGSLYREEKMYDRAMDAWSRALAADPDQTDIEGSLRSLAREAKRPLPPAALNAGVLRDLEDRVRRRDYSAAALDAARRARSLFPRSMKARYYLGNLELIHGRPGPAVELLAPLGEAQPANAALQRNLGEAYLQLGRTDEAIKAFRAALRADPADARARRRLSELGQNP